jgi:hypothetical protein
MAQVEETIIIIIIIIKKDPVFLKIKSNIDQFLTYHFCLFISINKISMTSSASFLTKKLNDTKII